MTGMQFVKPDGNDNYNGTSWSDAKQTFNKAVRALPIMDSGKATQRFAGVVEAAPGYYTETVTPIPIHADLQIKGNGNSFGNGTKIVLGSGRNTSLFTWRETLGLTNEPGNPPPYTDYIAGMLLQNLFLLGNKANNPSAPPLVRLVNGGFNCIIRDCHIRDAKSHGLYVQRNMLTLHMERVSFSKCDGSAVYFRHDGTSSADVLWLGGEIDDCGLGASAKAAILIEENGKPVAGNTFNFMGVKGEFNVGFIGAQSFIRFKPYTQTGGSPININVVGCNAQHNGCPTDGFCYEASGTGNGANWTLVGTGGAALFTKALKSDKTSFSTAGPRVGFYSTLGVE